MRIRADTHCFLEGNFLMKSRILIVIFAVLTVLSALCSCGEGSGDKDMSKLSTLSQKNMPEEGEEIGVITTSMGVIKVRFFPKYAPNAVENFVTLAKEGYYDGVIFHRVMKDFMVQSGDPTGTGYGGESIWGGYFDDEVCSELRNFRGALSMARTTKKNTNQSQFFIVQNAGYSDSQKEKIKSYYGISDEIMAQYDEVGGGAPWLDGEHTVFGQVFEGMDVVDAIAGVAVDENSKPDTDVTIIKIEITTYKGD